MPKLKMISVMLLVSCALLGCKGEDIDICTFSKQFQKFYCHNEFTGKDWEYSAVQAPTDMVCMPYDQYVNFQKEYVCKKK